MSLTWCSNMVDINEGNWLQLLFYLIVLMATVASDIGIRFFSYVSGFRLKVSRIALWRNRLQLDSKSDLTTKELILGIFVGKWLFSPASYLYGLKSARIPQLLFFFWRHPIFSMFSLRGILVCSLKMLVFLAIWFCDIDWEALGKQCNFTLCLFLSSIFFFLELVVTVFDYFWKPISLFSKLSVNCLLMLYFVYCTNCFLNDINGAC